jgi:hypothetical protein
MCQENAAHRTQRRLMRGFSCPKFNRQAGWLRKMVQQLLSAGLALSSIWEKARARDGQRKVAGDKEQWALFCKG